MLLVAANFAMNGSNCFGPVIEWIYGKKKYDEAFV